MPYKSDAQRRYFNANREELEEQGVDVDEWNESTKGKKLPEKVKEEKKAFAPMMRSLANFTGNPYTYMKNEGQRSHDQFLNPGGNIKGPFDPQVQAETQRAEQRNRILNGAGTNGVGLPRNMPDTSGMYSQMNQIARQPNMMGTGGWNWK